MNNFSSPKISPSVRWRTPCHLAHHRAHERKTRQTGRPHCGLPQPAEARRPDRGPYAPQDEVGFGADHRRAGAGRVALDLLALTIPRAMKCLIRIAVLAAAAVSIVAAANAAWAGKRGAGHASGAHSSG